MALTRDFKETVQARAKSDPAFRRALLHEGVECLLSGDLDTGKVVLRDYINATLGFEELGSRTARSAKSLMRMFGPSGNPQARNLFEVIGCLQRHEGVHLEVRANGYAGGSSTAASVAESEGEGEFGRWPGGSSPPQDHSEQTITPTHDFKETNQRHRNATRRYVKR